MRPAHEGKEWIFVSDAHFTGRHPGEMESFLSFLDKGKGEMSHLVILGDVFEFLFGFRPFPSRLTSPFDDGSFPYPEYLPVFRQLFSLYQHGIRIKYFEGNHDFSLSSFFADHFGMDVEVHSEGHEEWLGAKRAFVAHGDLSNPRQWKYRTFRRILKNRVTEQLVHWVGPKLTRWVAKTLTEQSYRYYHQNTPTKPSSASVPEPQCGFKEGARCAATY